MLIGRINGVGNLGGRINGVKNLDGEISGIRGLKGDKGDKGDTGETGNGIASVTKTSTAGLVDTYTVTYTNGNTSTFTLTNGQDGTDGQDGADGFSPIANVSKVGNTATITITDENGTTTATVSDYSALDVYVTPEMYGAIGDGTTDDADAFESAINSGKPVIVPAKSYYISRPIDNISKVVLIGCGRRSTSIKLGDSLFDNSIANSIIQDIYFYCTNSNDSNFYAFSNTLTNTRVAYCEFHFFDKIFARLETCCVVTGNWFRYVKTTLVAQCVDAFISDNYLSGAGVKNPQTTVFSESLSSTTINGNFFSYCYKVFSIPSTMGNVSIVNNIFDTCYCIFYNHIGGVTFTGNTINHLKKQGSWDVSENNDMNTKSWAVMKRVLDNDVSWWWVESTLADNTINGDFDLYMDCESLTRYPTYDLLIDENCDASKFNYGATFNSGIANDFNNIRIRPMLKRTVGSLPSADLTGNAVSFNYDEVVYSGDVYTNVNGTWKHLDNVQADWNQSVNTADDYIKNKPTIPTVNDATLTIQKNSTNVATFTANASSNVTADISVPTNTNELTNGAGFITSPNVVYCTCSTAGATQQKDATIVSGTLTTLTTGCQAIVKFDNANGKADPTLKIGTTEAKSIKRYGTSAPSTSASSSWNAGSAILFVYDGTYWQQIGYLNTTYSEISEANITNGSGSSTGLASGRRVKKAVETFAPVTSVNSQTGAVTLTIPSTAGDVGAIASPSSPTSGDFLVYNGSAWVAQSLSTWQGGNY